MAKTARLNAVRLAASESLVSDGLVTLREACRFLAISRATLYRLMQAGELQSAKIGKGRRIPRSSLVAFAARSLDARATTRSREDLTPKPATVAATRPRRRAERWR